MKVVPYLMKHKKTNFRLTCTPLADLSTDLIIRTGVTSVYIEIIYLKRHLCLYIMVLRTKILVVVPDEHLAYKILISLDVS